MLFSLLLTRKNTFFLFLVILSNFIIILVVKEKIKVKLALAIATGAPVAVVKEMKLLHHFMQKEQLKFAYVIKFRYTFTYFFTV